MPELPAIRDEKPAVPPERLPVFEDDTPGDNADEDDDLFERPKIKLTDVGGMEAVKRRLHLSFLGPLRNPQIREIYGKSLRGGMLLYGPPGCGKTYIARATAGELGAKFHSVGLADCLRHVGGLKLKKIYSDSSSVRDASLRQLSFSMRSML